MSPLMTGAAKVGRDSRLLDGRPAGVRAEVDRHVAGRVRGRAGAGDRPAILDQAQAARAIDDRDRGPVGRRRWR